MGHMVEDMKTKTLEEIYLSSAYHLGQDLTGLVGSCCWGKEIITPHSFPCEVIGLCDSVLVHLITATGGNGIVSAPVPKKLLMMAGIDDCYTSA